MTAPDPTPQLQPPGAGLPAVELFLARIWFRLMGLTVSRRTASRRFRTEADRILALARSLGGAAASRRVLVPRLRGLEDSSRFWSVYMTLEHLCIVQSGITGVMESLAAGRAVNRAVSMAAVKPGPTADAATIDRFEAVARDHLARTDALTGWDSKVSLAHPWFGALRVPQWHRLAAFHLRVHRKQIERIIGLLPHEANTV
ncbi:DinB family protein [Frigoriglobus tundricola]|uniref:Uncharacterized protein n=1 Tax=Frigoriglobus tundricola TaxID=2774151 RepID=A0A6M5YXT4_9BACT|nr:DinB family protein [Frigoriglobus tundricola]QJW98819.1 hypothetical protein FTUN_6414 [Frigoriglobus tundricola]